MHQLEPLPCACMEPVRNNRPAPFPDLLDERPAFVRLYGRNLLPNAEIDGWSHHYAEYFTNLETLEPKDEITKRLIRTYDLQILESRQDLNDNDQHGDDDEVMDTATTTARPFPHFEEDFVYVNYKNCITLSQMFCGRLLITSEKTTRPVFVTVIAKKCIELTILKDRKAMVFGQLIVGDDSGVCTVKFVNTAIQMAYNFISIGDKLLIDSALISPNSTNEVLNFGIQPEILPGMLKIGEFDCAKLVRFNGGDTIESISKFFVSTFKRLWTPSTVPDSKQSTWIVGDIVGVLCHVGRFERRRRHESPVILSDESTDVNFVQFDVTCWIELVDKDAKDPLPLLLSLNSLTWSKREQLVPGSLIVITNVGFKFNWRGHEESFNNMLHSGPHSQIYTNACVETYSNLMTSDHVDLTLKEFLGTNTTGILKRPDVTWSIGGGYPLPVEDYATFVIKVYWEKEIFFKEVGPWYTVPKLPMYRRESQLLVFEGVVIRYNLYKSGAQDDFKKWTWINDWAITEYAVPHCRNMEKIFHPIPADTSGTLLWFLWKRKLPTFQFPLDIPEVDDITRQLQVFRHKTRPFEDLTKAISMPAGIAKGLQKLPVLDGDPHFAVDLWNKETTDVDFKRLTFTWKPSRHLSIEAIQNKLIELQSCKTVLVIAKVYRTESIGLEEKMGHDFMLHDILPFDSTFDLEHRRLVVDGLLQGEATSS